LTVLEDAVEAVALVAAAEVVSVEVTEDLHVASEVVIEVVPEDSAVVTVVFPEASVVGTAEASVAETVEDSVAVTEADSEAETEEDSVEATEEASEEAIGERSEEDAEVSGERPEEREPRAHRSTVRFRTVSSCGSCTKLPQLSKKPKNSLPDSIQDTLGQREPTIKPPTFSFSQTSSRSKPPKSS